MYEINLQDANGVYIAEIASAAIEINTPQDGLNVLVNCGYQGAEGVILHQQNIAPTFFDLKSGMAGEILQKFSNYKMKLAIVGNFEIYDSKSLKDFIRESNKRGMVSFVSSVEEARQALGMRHAVTTA